MYKYLFYYIIIYVWSINLAIADFDNWNKIRSRGLKIGTLYEISSGTGFFISPHYIVTSSHVVENCLTISIRGAVMPASAELIDYDQKSDLALLQTSAIAKNIASIRANLDLNLGDYLFIVGYPNGRTRDGLYTTKQAQIIGLNSENNELQQIEFTSVIEHGNSGGPVIDTQGQVVGVVEAKRKYYTVILDESGKEISQDNHPFKIEGMAIGITPLINFLNKNKVNYKTAISNNLVLNYNSAIQAESYIVNIHCVRPQTSNSKLTVEVN